MFSKSAWLLGAAMAASLALPAVAQVQSSALTDATPWAYNFLPEDEPKLPDTSWTAASPEQMLAELRKTRIGNLSPVEQTLLRRLILSGADRPSGELADTLLAERARIMVEIGEARAAARLLPELEELPKGMTADELAVDLRMALGENDAACAEGLQGDRTGKYWARLRAICYTLQEDTARAELAIEFAAAEGITDAWLARAVFFANEIIEDEPEARFDDGLNLALSAKARLGPSETSISSSRKDIAAAIARIDSFEPALRAQAAGVASEAGLLDPALHASIYTSLIAAENFKPRTPLEVAIVTAAKSPEAIGARARTLRAALRTSLGNPSRFSAVSRLLLADIKDMPRNEVTARMALTFARASIAAGDMGEAIKWVTPIKSDPPEDDAETEEASDAAAETDEPAKPEYAELWIRAVVAMASTGGDSLEARTETLEALLDASDNNQTKRATARLLTLATAFDTPLPAAARTVLAEAKIDTPALSPFKQRALMAAAEAGAGSEVVLSALAMISGDAYKLHPADAATLIEALRQIGQEDAARQLALEAAGYWRATL